MCWTKYVLSLRGIFLFHLFGLTACLGPEPLRAVLRANSLARIHPARTSRAPLGISLQNFVGLRRWGKTLGEKT